MVVPQKGSHQRLGNANVSFAAFQFQGSFIVA